MNFYSETDLKLKEQLASSVSIHYIIYKIIEECGELTAVLAQYFIFQRKTEKKVFEELSDLLNWITCLCIKNSGVLRGITENNKRINSKLKTILKEVK